MCQDPDHWSLNTLKQHKKQQIHHWKIRELQQSKYYFFWDSQTVLASIKLTISTNKLLYYFWKHWKIDKRSLYHVQITSYSSSTEKLKKIFYKRVVYRVLHHSYKLGIPYNWNMLTSNTCAKSEKAKSIALLPSLNKPQ